MDLTAIWLGGLSAFVVFQAITILGLASRIEQIRQAMLMLGRLAQELKEYSDDNDNATQ